jgi:hypothetical protein
MDRMVNVALPSIQSELGFGPAAVTWVVNAYVLAFTGLLLLSGRAADLFGRRRVFVVGASLFTVGTLLAAVALTKELLILGRVVQGIGGRRPESGGHVPVARHLPGGTTRPGDGGVGCCVDAGWSHRRRERGVLAGTVGWRAVFLVTVPVSLAAIALARRVLVDDAPGVRRTVDWAGAAAVTGAVITLVHGAVDAVDHAWTPRGSWTVRRLVGPDGSVHRHRAPGRGPAGPSRALPVAHAAHRNCRRAARRGVPRLDLRPGRALLPAGPRDVSGAGGRRHGPHVPHGVRRLVGRAAASVGRDRTGAQHGPRARRPRRRAPLAGERANRIRVRRRRPPGPAPRRDGRRPQLHPTTMVLTSVVHASHTGLAASGLAGASMQVGGALGTAAFIVIGISSGRPVEGALDVAGFSAAFTAAAVVALLTAALGATLARPRF